MSNEQQRGHDVIIENFSLDILGLRRQKIFFFFFYKGPYQKSLGTPGKACKMK